MQGIVIQGPTNYCREVAPLYKDRPNIVWSTWEDEPEENIEFIKQFTPVVLSKKPSFPGFGNLNMQTVSTMGGVSYLKDLGVTEVLKTRGDIRITNLDSFLKLLKGRSLSFLAINKEGIRPDLYYRLVYDHFSHDYPIDLVVYGSIENIELMFDLYVEEFYQAPAESMLAYNFMTKKGLDFKLEYNFFIKNGISFYLADCLENNIQLQWVKHGGRDLVEWQNTFEYAF